MKTEHELEAALPTIELELYYKTEKLLNNCTIEVIPGLIVPPGEEKQEEEKESKPTKLMQKLDE